MSIKLLCNEEAITEGKSITFENKMYPNDGWMVFLAGGAGSGKSYTLDKQIMIDGKLSGDPKFDDVISTDLCANENLTNEQIDIILSEDFIENNNIRYLLYRSRSIIKTFKKLDNYMVAVGNNSDIILFENDIVKWNQDSDNMYLFVGDDNCLVVSKKGFTQGSADDLRQLADAVIGMRNVTGNSQQ